MSGESSSRHLTPEAPTDRYSNLSWSTDDQALTETFEKYGEIEKAVSVLLLDEGIWSDRC